ncbi:MAG: caspase family protein, partial [Planctomycetia bacterium]|nr:caspase family protein [Planctomycetia bacterium]
MKKRAYLFGINEYTKLAPLNFARSDAEAVAGALKKSYGFQENEVVLRTCKGTPSEMPLTAEAVLDTIRWTEEVELLILGFWGHGVVLNGERYICPITTQIDNIEGTAVPLSKILETVRQIPAKKVCILLDCCQSRLEKGRPLEETPTFERGEAERLEQMVGEIFTSRDIQMRVNASPRRENTAQPSGQTVAILNACSDGERAYEW